MYGFVETELTDHAFSKYLADKSALDRHEALGNSVSWKDDKGKTVAVAFYDNENCTRKIWIAES